MIDSVHCIMSKSGFHVYRDDPYCESCGEPLQPYWDKLKSIITKGDGHGVAGRNVLYPLVEYARKIGKNTADMTAYDMAKFTKWWIQQKPRKELLDMGRKIVAKAKQNEQVNGAKILRNKKEEVVEMDEVEEMETIEESEGETVEEQEPVCEIGLTQQDVDALVWAVSTVLGEYDFSEMLEVQEALTGIQTALGEYATNEE